jgi:hypothetical protein
MCCSTGGVSCPFTHVLPVCEKGVSCHAGGDLYLPLVTPNMAHHIVSGNNHMSGVLLLGNLPAGSETLERRDGPRVVDVAPTVLHLLGVTAADEDGQPLVLPPVVYSRLVLPLLSLPMLPR